MIQLSPKCLTSEILCVSVFKCLPKWINFYDPAKTREYNGFALAIFMHINKHIRAPIGVLGAS